MVNQISGKYQARGFKMMTYLSKAKDTLTQFDLYSIQKVPQDENSDADALARLASTKESESLGAIPVEYLPNPSITGGETVIIQAADTWITPIIKSLKNGALPNNQNKARKLRRQAARFLILDEFCIDADTLCLCYDVSQKKSQSCCSKRSTEDSVETTLGAKPIKENPTIRIFLANYE